MNTKQRKAFGTAAADASLEELAIDRREPSPHDVEMDILYCGICHSDLHAARNEWGGSKYPLVPGHEIIGRVTRVGDHVSKFKMGDMAAIGCIVDSCRTCHYCAEGFEQFCEAGNTIVFGSPDKYLGGSNYGGFSESIVANEDFILHVPAGLDPAAAAPLLCAGITTYSPLRHWKVGPGSRVGIVGIGGLGHLAIKIAKAMGAYVVVFTTSAAKAADAKRLGADEAVLSTDAEQMKQRLKLNMILDTVSAKHNANDYINHLAVDGTLVLVGLPIEPLSIGAFNIVKGRKSVAGSNIGGIAETQEMLDFCAAHNITADIELIGVHDINTAFDRLEHGDVHYRFVVDMATLKG